MVQGLGIALTTSAVVIAGNGIHGVIRVRVRNRGAGVAYLSDATATTGLGYQLTTADSPIEIVLQGGEVLYGTSTGAAVLDVLRLGDTT